MDYFIAETADEQPVTVAIDEKLDLALIVLGGDPDAASWSGPVLDGLAFKDEICLFDLSEAWALWAAIRDNPGRSPGAIRKAAHLLIEPWQLTRFTGGYRPNYGLHREGRPSVGVSPVANEDGEVRELAEAILGFLNKSGL